MPIITLNTIINAPISRCFDLSRSIDLHLKSSLNTEEKVLSTKKSGLIELGESVTWQAKHFGIKQKLTSRIATLKRPSYFEDMMVSGPFKKFRHFHYFKEEESKTIMRDVFDYTSPFGIVGQIIDLLVLERYMTQFLINRNQTLKNIAESDEWKNYL